METFIYFTTPLFYVCIVYSLWVVYISFQKIKWAFPIVLIWTSLQLLVSSTGFYEETRAIPPRFILLIGPNIIAIMFLFFNKKGKEILNQIDVDQLFWIHPVRIVVEFCLWGLYLQHLIPQLMTFEGTNLDILIGISSLIVIYLLKINKILSAKTLKIWNYIGLIFLANIVLTALLAAPTAFQQIAFEQANTGVFISPFTLLPGFIVPLVLLSHLLAIKKLSHIA
ncbi:MAG: hypothetical protein ACOVP1_13470 [Bacteroidia bacterium]